MKPRFTKVFNLKVPGGGKLRVKSGGGGGSDTIYIYTYIPKAPLGPRVPHVPD